MQENIPVVSISKFVEVRLATRRFKDWRDVVELLRRNQLTEVFALQLNPSVQFAYKQCFD